MNKKWFLGIVLLLFLANVGIGQHNLYHNSSQDKFDKALQLYEKGHYNACIKAFEHVPSNSNFYQESRLYIAISHLMLFHQNAYVELEQIAKQNNGYVASLAYFEMGNYAFRNEQYAKAAGNYEEVNTDFLEEADLTELEFKKAYSYFSQKEFNRAKPGFYNSKIHHSKYQAASTYYLGFIAMETSAWDKALENLRSIEDDKGYSRIVPSMIIKSLYMQEEYEEVLKYYEEKKSGRFASWNTASMYAGAAAYELKEYKKAVDYYSPYFKTGGNKERENHYRMGMSYFYLKDYEKSINHLKFAAFPDDSLAQITSYYLGICHSKVGNLNFAAPAFKHAASLDFDKQVKEEALWNWAKSGYEAGNKSEAIIALRSLLEEFPQTGFKNEANALLSRAYFESDNYYDALVYLESVKNKSQEVKRSYQFAAYMLTVKEYNCNDLEDAALYLDKAFNYPVDQEILASSYYLKGEMLSKEERYNEAVLAYAGVFQSGVGKDFKYYLKSRYGIAYAYFNHKEYERAKGHFQYVIDHAQSSTLRDDANIRLGDCFYVQKKYMEASKAYSRVKNYKVDYAVYQNGLVNYLASNFDQSKAHFNSLIDMFPKSGFVDNSLYQVGQIENEQGNYPEAIKYFTRLLEQFKYSNLVPLALERRALAYSNLKNYKKAKSDYVSIIDNYLNSSVAKNAIYGLQDVLTKLNDLESFEPYLAKYKKANPEDTGTEKIEFENAKSLLYTEKYKAAIKSFNDFMQSYPQSSLIFDGKYYLAEAYRYYGMEKKAMEMYEAVIQDDKSFFTNKAVAKVAELYFENERYKEAIEKYDLLALRSKKNKDILRSKTGKVLSLFALGEYQKVIEEVNEFEQNVVSIGNQEYQLILKRGDAYNELDKDSMALKDYRYITKNSNFESGAIAQYGIAQIYFKNKQYEKSIKTLRTLSDKYASFDYWVAKGFILIADNYVEMGEVFQAKATLNSVKDNTSYKDLKEQCKIKLQYLEQSLEPEPADSVLNDTIILETPEINDNELD